MRSGNAKYRYTLEESMEGLTRGAKHIPSGERQLKKIPEDFKRKWIAEHVPSIDVCSWCDKDARAWGHYGTICEIEAKQRGFEVHHVTHYIDFYVGDLLDAYGRRCEVCGDPSERRFTLDDDEPTLCESHRKKFDNKMRAYTRKVKKITDEYEHQINLLKCEMSEKIEDLQDMKDTLILEFLNYQLKRQVKTLE